MDTFTSKEFVKTLITIPETLKLIFRLEKKYAIYLIVLNMITALIPLAGLFVYQELINSLFATTNYIVIILVIYVVLQILSALLNQVKTYISGKFNMLFSYSLNIKLMEKTSSLELSDYENADMYNLIENVTQDSTYKPFQLFNAIIGVISSFLSLLASLFYIGTWSVPISFFLLIIPILSLVLFLKVGQLEFLIQWKRAGLERESWYITYLLTHDFSFKEVKLNNISNYFIKKYSKLRKIFINQDLSIAKKKALFNTSLDIVLNMINTIIIFLMINSVRMGSLLLGNLVSLIQALTKINTYSQSMIQDIYIIYNTSLFMEQLFDFLDESKKKVNQKNESENPLSEIDEVVISKVSYVYPTSEFKALRDINLNFKRGELIAIVGKNGSGKSTLVKLLAGLYKPSSGNIYYNGYAASALSGDFYQRNISVLFQDFVKYELTVRENIGLSNLDLINDDFVLEKTLEQFSLDFLKLDNQYDLQMQLGTWFQEGRQLSGGQWQKIALARTFFKNASIYIFDEPSASLDSVSGKAIFDDFVLLAKNRISIFVSHNLNFVQKADRIIVMKDGCIIDEGKHQDLLLRCTYYEELYYSEQYKEEE